MKEISKEEVNGLSYKDITNLILEREKKGMNTLDLFTKIVDLLELPKSVIDTKIADYYTSLTTDKRFLLVDGSWDLRSRHTSDKVLSNVEEDEEEESFDEMEDDYEEDEEYNNDNLDDDTSYDEDDELGDLVVIDEDEIDMDNE